MYLVCVTSLFISYFKSNIFLFIIGIFSFYLVSSGNRYLYKKRFKKGQTIPVYDWILASFMLIAGIFFIGYGIFAILKNQMMGIVMIVFGSIGAINARLDFLFFLNGPKHRKVWLLFHIGRIIGATTAAYTAFLVVNSHYFPMVPNYILWLLPIPIFIPLAIYFSRREKNNSPDLV